MDEREELIARADKYLNTGAGEYASEIMRDMADYIRRSIPAQGMLESAGYRAAWLELMEHCNKLKEENFNLRSAAQTAEVLLRCAACGTLNSFEPSNPAQQERWQPIETAPRDKLLLCFWKSHGNGVSDSWSTGGYFRGRWRSDEDDDSHFGSPTHWMHLPVQPPEGGGK